MLRVLINATALQIATTGLGRDEYRPTVPNIRMLCYWEIYKKVSLWWFALAIHLKWASESRVHARVCECFQKWCPPTVCCVVLLLHKLQFIPSLLNSILPYSSLLCPTIRWTSGFIGQWDFLSSYSYHVSPFLLHRTLCCLVPLVASRRTSAWASSTVRSRDVSPMVHLP